MNEARKAEILGRLEAAGLHPVVIGEFRKRLETGARCLECDYCKRTPGGFRCVGESKGKGRGKPVCGYVNTPRDCSLYSPEGWAL